MYTPLLPLPALGRRLRHLLGAAVLLGSAATAQAQTTVWALGTVSQTIPAGVNQFFPLGAAAGTQGIVPFNPNANNQPQGLAQPISGLASGQVLVGMDYRPNTGQLFALGYDATTAGNNAQVYTLAPATGVATAVGSGLRLELGGATDRIGFDFNPTVDRIRVVSTNRADYRLNPNNGALVLRDGDLTYAAGDANAALTPGVGSAAYTNSYIGSTSTTLYDIDETNGGILVTQSPPNNGTLNTVAAISLDGFPVGTVPALDLDIYFDGTNNIGFLSLVTRPNVSGFSSSDLYRVNLSTGAASSKVNLIPASIVAPFNLFDIAIPVAPPTPGPLVGQLAYAVTEANALISFDTQAPSVVRSLSFITGVAANQTLVGTDFRPNTGQLFGLGYNPTAGANDRLYTIDLATGVATPVGTADIDLDLGDASNTIGFDFNPTVDRIRVVSSNGNNYRLNPVNGAVVIKDGNLAYAAGDANAGQTPTVGSAAYLNSYVGATGTGLYVLDHVRGTISWQNPPNDGVLTTSRALTGVNGAGVGGAISGLNDLDSYFDGTANINYLAAAPAGQIFSRFFALDAFSATLTTPQVATDRGRIGQGIGVRDISILLAPTSVANASATLTGQLLYGIASGNLVSFDSGNPGVIRTAVNITGLPATQVLVGSDFRPANGALYALGYDATNSQGQLYTLNLTSGALTAVGALTGYTLGAATGIGFDFNPAADRIRITGANGNNYRTNPADGVTIVDGVTGGAISAGAYTNNDNNTATGTVLYGYDQATNQVVQFSNPNAGTNAPLGASGITVNAANGVEFDIYSDITNPATPVNTAFASAAATGTTTDNLYSVSLTSGAFSSLGRIGNGSNLGGLAAFLTPGPILPVAFTWTGAVSTDWGTGGNWSTGTVPTTADNVTIPGGTPNQPTTTGTNLAGSVTLTTGAILTLAPNSVLLTAGNFTNNGGSIAGTGTYSVSGANTVIGGTNPTTFPSLAVGINAASTTAPVSISRSLLLTSNLNIGAGQPFTLLSTATGTAYVVNNGGTVNGTATVQRYIDPSRNGGVGYRHYSAPVANSTVADLATAGFAPVVNPAYNTTGNTVTPFPNVFGYNEARVNPSTPSGTPSPAPEFDKGFFSPNATGDALEVTRGYTVNIAATANVDFTGTLNNGPLSATGLTRGSQPESGWHLRGNPYPSALNWQSVLDANRATNIENALYVFKSSGQYTGTYASYANGVGTNGGTSVLPVAQGFFVRTVTGQTGSVSFTNADRVAAFDATPFQRNTADTRPQLTLTLSNASARTQAAMYFEQGATAGFDRAFDAHALPSPNGLVLATETAAAEPLAINGQPALTAAEVVLPLRVASAAAGTYTLSVDNLANLPATYRAYLRDAVAGTYTDLTTTPSVTLSLAANGAAGGRYAVVFTTQNRVLATAPAALAQLASVYPNPATGKATLLLPAALRGNKATAVSVVDNLGRTVLSSTLAAGAGETLELSLSTLAPGVYSVQARTAAGLVAKRLVVQ
ncbi:MAG TPA: DUF4394 domain-containing protein [Hymenobacter sp.]|jgi:hypothetical protein|uniref:DUF4394 domain-containing protein n=1 Tax=Hymenobacter sp. TaxID=1898978 RepID=UPI002ED86F64